MKSAGWKKLEKHGHGLNKKAVQLRLDKERAQRRQEKRNAEIVAGRNWGKMSRKLTLHMMPDKGFEIAFSKQCISDNF